jgi:hypothetical protein
VRQAEFYVLADFIEYQGEIAKPGYFARERMGAEHPKTTFSEKAIYLFT